MLKLTKERTARGWSKSELARRSRLNQVTVGQIELGRRIPYDSELVKLAQGLGFQGEPCELMSEVPN